MIATGQFVAKYQRQGTHAAAPDLELTPLARRVGDRRPRIEITGDPFHLRIDQQIYRIIIEIGGEAVDESRGFVGF